MIVLTKEEKMQLLQNNWYAFSERELECLNYLLRGKTFKEIGAALGLSHRTIEAYVKNMRMKAGVPSKKQLVEKVIQINNQRALAKEIE